MARKRRFNARRQKKQQRRSSPASAPVLAPLAFEKKPPVQYGKPVTILEDEDKNTFEFKSGTWVPYAMSIAECREHCRVDELPQKVNRKTRYEVRLPISQIED